MRRRSRTRRMLKWAATVVTVLLLVAWLFAIRLSVDVTQGYSIRLTGQGEIQVLLWGTLRSEPEPDSHPHQPDCYTFPLWLPFVLLAIPTAVLWFVDRRRRTRPGYCQRCGYDLTGNVSGRCPECGERIVKEGE
jgi:hypothetical protein